MTIFALTRLTRVVKVLKVVLTSSVKKRCPGNFILISSLVESRELSTARISAHSCLAVSRGMDPFVSPLRDGRERGACGSLPALW